MRSTLEDWRDDYGPLEMVAEHGNMALYEDCDGDHVLVKSPFGESNGHDDSAAILFKGGVPDDALKCLHDAGLLPEEYQPDDDDTRSPEDMAETWIKATDHRGLTQTIPMDDDLEVLPAPDSTEGNPLKIRHPSIPYRDFYTRDVERLDAEDVDPSEVPVDE